MNKVFLSAIMAISISTAAFAANEAIELPAPEKSGGPSLLQALSERRSAREFADIGLTPQQLSNLLWATAGVNREDGRRVYPVLTLLSDKIIENS